MVHCGYEPTAVADTIAHPIKALKVALFGIDTEKPLAPEVPLNNQRPAEFVFENLVKTLSEQKDRVEENIKSDAA